MSPISTELSAISREGPTDGVSRRRAALTRTDLAALISGAIIVLAMLLWFSWRMSRNVARDREVDARAAAPAHVQ